MLTLKTLIMDYNGDIQTVQYRMVSESLGRKTLENKDEQGSTTKDLKYYICGENPKGNKEILESRETSKVVLMKASFVFFSPSLSISSSPLLSGLSFFCLSYVIHSFHQHFIINTFKKIVKVKKMETSKTTE